MSAAITQAMVLAAGLGTRMQPLTGSRPKPLLVVGGRTLLDHALDRLAEAGVGRVVVNAHWLGSQIADRLRARAALDGRGPETLLQDEPDLLETGGAVLAALESGALSRDAPFFVVNGDSFWLDGPQPALRRMTAAFDAAETDVLLLVARTASSIGDTGAGDFAIDEFGRLRRPRENEIVPYMFAGVQLAAPSLFAGIRHGRFSMNLLWDQAIGAGRIRALVHDGPWFHLSRPAQIAQTERALRDPQVGPESA